MERFITDPSLIETKSMEIIDEILGEVDFEPDQLKVVKRVIHTTADFEYAKILTFHNEPIEAVKAAIKEGKHIVTDTNMALAGINKRVLAKYGVEVKCFISDEEVARLAKEKKVTRAIVSMEYAAQNEKNGIFVIGNAPTALMKLINMMETGEIKPAAIIGVPVGFVGAKESKVILAETAVPHITTLSRKGGSNVAAAIVNAIAYMMEEGLSGAR